MRKMTEMNLTSNRLASIHKLSVILISCLLILGCSTAKPIEHPNAKELTSRISEATINDVIIQAVILDTDQTWKLFDAALINRSLIPILFVVNNKSAAGLELRREHFSAVFGTHRIEPAMPGRAASLLRDSKGSTSAIYAGIILLGPLAAPAINDADKKEIAAVESHRETIFSVATLPPGGRVEGYLFFESPIAFRSLNLLNLEYCKSGNKNELINIHLVNPYSDNSNK